jgi:hypothetical protein
MSPVGERSAWARSNPLETDVDALSSIQVRETWAGAPRLPARVTSRRWNAHSFAPTKLGLRFSTNAFTAS